MIVMQLKAPGGGRMTDHMTAPGKDDRALRPGKEELTRLLLEEFYSDSVGRYGRDSEQARTFSRLLIAGDLKPPVSASSRSKIPHHLIRE